MSKNPLMNFMQMGQMMNNPQAAMLNMLGQQNPDFAKALNMLQGKSPQEIQAAVTKMYQDKGLDVNQFMGQAESMMKQFGIK